MKVGITFDLREDYGIERNSNVWADFCHPDEIGYMAKGIEAAGFEPVLLGNMYKLNDAIFSGKFDCDYVLICDEGLKSRNREAIVPALLELNKIKYIGSDAYTMGLSQNKYHTNLVAKTLGLKCPKDVYVDFKLDYKNAKESLLQMIHEGMKKESLEYPVIVKPNCEGYSMGVFKVENDKELWDAIVFNFENYEEPILVEEYIKGKEVYVPIIGNGDNAYALNVGIAKYENGEDIDIFSLDDKCFKPVIDEIAVISEETKKDIFEQSLLIYKHLECKDFGRCDFKIMDDGTPVFLEINPRPGLTEDGPYETCGKSLNKSYSDILKEIIDAARSRYEER